MQLSMYILQFVMCSVFVQLCDICVELMSHVTVITLPIDALAGHHVVIDVVIVLTCQLMYIQCC